MLRDEFMPDARQGETPDEAPDALGRLRDLGRELFLSWRTEWSTLAGELWAKYARNRRGALTAQLDGDDAAVFNSIEGHATEIGRIERYESGASSRLAQICTVADAACDVTIVLPSSTVLRARVDLPKTSRRNLLQALRYELARLSPVEADQVYFDYDVLPGERGAKIHGISLRIVKREEVDDAVALCRNAGLHVGSIEFSGDHRQVDFRLFPIDRAAFARMLWRKWNLALLAGAALLLCLVLLGAVVERNIEAGQLLDTQVSREARRATAVERLEHQANVARGEAAFLEAQKQSPMLVAILADLSRTLPDGTWITQVNLEGNKLHLEGYSHAAADLISVLDKSAMFKDAQFTAPLTQNTRAGIEQFDLSVSVRGSPP